MEYTPEQRQVNFETYLHIWHVQRFIQACVKGYVHSFFVNEPPKQGRNLVTLLAEMVNALSIVGRPPGQLYKIMQNTLDYIGDSDPNVFVLDTLTRRMVTHDQSKLGTIEVSLFTEYTPKLKTVRFGSDQYKAFLNQLKPALDNHYACNRHHPEYYDSGVEGMTLIDVIEMVCDWSASSKRSKDGSFANSLSHCKERFGIDNDLARFINNTYLEYLHPIYSLEPRHYEVQT